MNKRIEVLLLMLMGIIILLMVANLALFVRMNQLLLVGGGWFMLL